MPAQGLQAKIKNRCLIERGQSAQLWTSIDSRARGSLGGGPTAVAKTAAKIWPRSIDQTTPVMQQGTDKTIAIADLQLTTGDQRTCQHLPAPRRAQLCKISAQKGKLDLADQRRRFGATDVTIFCASCGRMFAQKNVLRPIDLSVQFFKPRHGQALLLRAHVLHRLWHFFALAFHATAS